ncbi:MAG: hypothetical protein COW71_08350 [Ignavibacteriales bacterium CG18_big_fil_WC_8_21_14_2_50_31_20]|nr:MAG: hypothetical protein COW71_08350 [Ignavibacteriales bacterium CG18_big_fil_WC_8_21_14_2_50_31_20]
MKLNTKQKKSLVTGLLFIVVAFIAWLGYGFEIFTKTEVLIEKTDELLGIVTKEWKEQFILGLDYTIGFSGIVALFTIVTIWFQRDKKN